MKNFQKLETFNNRIEAEIAKSYLESFGIDTHIIADDTANMYPSQDFISGVFLLVGKDDYPKAKELLDSLKIQ
jgi:hypothetical protein